MPEICPDAHVRQFECMDELTESNDKLLEKYRLSDQDELSQQEIRTGKMFYFVDFLAKIRKLNIDITVEQSRNFPDSLGLYMQSRITGEYSYLSCVPKDWMPEYSYLILDDRNLPTEEGDTPEVRGWRTVLVHLLKKKALTWPQVRDTFGDAMNFNSKRWECETQQFRS